jgi:hypothetical protein
MNRLRVLSLIRAAHPEPCLSASAAPARRARSSRIMPVCGYFGLVVVATLFGCAQSELFDLQGTTTDGTGGAQAEDGGTGMGSGGSFGTTGAGGSTPPGTGGVQSTGGENGTGGFVGTGGTPETGGTNGSGGTSGTGTGGSSASGQGGTNGSAGHGGFGTGGAVANGGHGGSGTGGVVGTGGSGTGGRVGSGGSSGSGTGGTSGTAPTFTQIYNTILTPYCAGGSCHSPGSSGGVSFSSKTNAYNAVKSRVTAGNGAGSSFYSTVNSGAMPRGASKLSAANLASIKAWIDAGAANN